VAADEVRLNLTERLLVNDSEIENLQAVYMGINSL